jgi:hypothetical protein
MENIGARVRSILSQMDNGTVGQSTFSGEIKALDLSELRQLGRAILKRDDTPGWFLDLVRAETASRLVSD